MGAMAREFFRTSPVLFFPLLALAIFMVVFVVVSVRAWLAQESSAARLPLDDGEGR